MKCKKCQQSKPKKDFIRSDKCYRCVYAEKLKLSIKVATRNRQCKICEQKLPQNRWAYCGEECAAIGDMKRHKNHWSRNLKGPLGVFKY